MHNNEAWEIWKKLPSFWWMVKRYKNANAYQDSLSKIKTLNGEYELRGPYKYV